MKIGHYTSSFNDLVEEFLKLFDKTTNRKFMIRRIGISFGDVIENKHVQLSLFVNQEKLDKEQDLENTINKIKIKEGKNSIIRGMNLEKRSYNYDKK